MKILVAAMMAFAITLECFAQHDFYRQELLNLADVSRLPQYRNGAMNQLSSYDRTDGNDDGFSGKYSALREEPGGLVIADLEGPGVVNRIWTPTPTADTIKFYFDGETKPRIAVPFINLFTGKDFPFLAPLCGNQIGGYYCYLPIPYEKSLKIVYAGKLFRFHQTQYRTLSKSDNVRSFSAEMFRSHQDIFKDVSAFWNKTRSPLSAYGTSVKSKKVSVTLRSGIDQEILSMNTGGRIVGLDLAAGNLLPFYRKILLSANWDNESKNAIEVPLHDFFGFAFGKPSMQSVLLGSNREHFYSFLPMPFDKSATIKLRYDKGEGSPDEVLVSGTVYYTTEKRNADNEGKLYVQSRRHYDIPSGVSHVISEIKGKGHYVGTILSTQGLQEGSTWYFEGDDRATIDGQLKLHGTGSEDYFNGGYYAVMDRWDRGMSLPIHGSLEYDLMTSRTGGYRFYLSDKLNFKESFQLTIEHQPDEKNNVRTDYTSLGFFYAENPKFENTSLNISNTSKVAYRDKLTPQGMLYSLYWLASASYEDPSIVFSMKRTDQWFGQIDPEAVPMAQIFLNGLDNGRYKLFVEYIVPPGSGPFSIWQRSSQVSEWISAGTDMPEKGGKTFYAGEIEITDEIKTITLRKKSPDTSVRIFSLMFERMN